MGRAMMYVPRAAAVGVMLALLLLGGSLLGPAADAQASEMTLPPTAGGDADGALRGFVSSGELPGTALRAQAQTQVTLFYDGFESGMSSWHPTGRWAITSYRAGTGSKSAYCVGSMVSPPGPYPPNISAGMRAGPFNLSDATGASLEFDTWFKTEANADWVIVGISTDGVLFHEAGGWGGTSGGWLHKTIDLAEYVAQPAVWIFFGFDSDGSTSYEGAYVDEVRLVATVAQPSPPPEEPLPLDFYEGWESGGSGWTITGSPTWAITSYRAGAGSKSVYCAGSTISPPGPYASNMVAWLEAGPFDLSNIDSASLEFDTWFDTELDADGFFAGASTDGNNYSGTEWTGDTDGWQHKTLDLAGFVGQPKVWIAFKFDSDGSTNHEGAYVDEIRLVTADTPPPPSPESPRFTDVSPGQYAYTQITDLAGRGIITGFTDGTFRPAVKVTRQQFAKMIVKALGLAVTGSETCSFFDVATQTGTDPFYPSKYVAICAARGITQGKTSFTFAPYDDITRQQLISMVTRAANLPEPPADYLPYFNPDQFSPREHYVNARRAAYAGLLNDLSFIDPRYSFYEPATRAQVCVILYNLLQL